MREGSMGLGALLGFVGSVAGVAAMGYSMKWLRKVLKPQMPEDGGEPLRFVPKRYNGQPATVALGRTVYVRVARREPSERTEQKLGTGIHWGYGLAMGAAYGAIRAAVPQPRSPLLAGALWGLTLWGVGDELAVPLLGLGAKPTSMPLRAHAMFLGGHVTYGIVTAACSALLARGLERRSAPSG